MSSFDTPSQEILSEDRTWAMVCHLAPFAGYFLAVPGAGVICAALVWLCRRDESEFVEIHGRNAINFQIMMALLALGSWLLVPFLVGIPLVVAVYIIAGVFAVIAALRAAAGRSYEYPVAVNMVQADSFRS